MFNGIKNFITRWGQRLGIIDKLKELNDHEEIIVNDDFYNKLKVWRELYKGYHDDFHLVSEMTLEGPSERKIYSLGLPKVIANEMATLIFNERAEISVSDEKFGEYIQQVLKDNKFNSRFQNALEYMFALGGMVIKPYYEDGKIKISFVTADCFYPTQWNAQGEIQGGVFLSEMQRNGKHYTHLEFHQFENGQYVVKNELYKSDNDLVIGKKVPLTELFQNLEEYVVFNDLKRPLFVYTKPNIANNIDTTSPLGISLYANSLSTIKAADRKYDSLMNEFELGRKRIVVPEHMVQVRVDEFKGTAKRLFNTRDSIYEAFKYDQDSNDANTIKEIDFNLRVDEHINAINSELELLAMKIGLSPGTFSYTAAEGLKTATEIISANSKTFRTKQSHENEVEQAITSMVEVIGILSELYGITTHPEEYEVTAFFDDSIIQDTDAKIDQQIKLVAAEFQSRVRAIKEIFGLTKEEAELRVLEINQEKLGSMPDFQQLQQQSSLFGGTE